MPTAARYHELRDRVIAAVDRKFAEPVRISPMSSGAADPDRPQFAIEGVLRVGGGKESAGAGMSQAWRTKIAAGRAELHIDRATYEGPLLKKGDAVRAIARPGEPAFEVLRVDDRGESRLVLELGEK